jgi:transketolase
MSRELEELGIKVVRGLSMDAPLKANSGHQGTAMALAPLASVLFTRVMTHDPSCPDWPDRDRFVLSAGHASILQYSMLYLTGYGLELDDLKSFRQWGSHTPGHPEVHHTKGVETTTGPLGQGFATAVGMGIAERWLRARFGPELCDHHTFVICSDGDLMEGVSHEAASAAGHLGLGRLVYVYDDNHITIDGPTEITYSDDVRSRFESYGWDVDDIGEVANDCDALEAALRRAMAVEDKPSLIVLRSHIGWPAPNATDTPEAHGMGLDAEEVRRTKEILGIPPDESFWVPPEVLDFYRSSTERGRSARVAWEERLAGFDGDRESYQACIEGRGLDGWHTKLPTFETGKGVATRVALNDCLNAIGDVVPGLVSGGADLTGNTGTQLKPADQQSKSKPDGRLMAYGIREHGMAAAMNGMAQHGGVLPVGGTFFVFSDYMRPAVRLAAMSESHCIFSWTHDSVGLGEDGPTHQPIEHLASLRAMPFLRLIRPADANETAAALRLAIDGDGPTGLVLSRQKVPTLEGTADRYEDIARGAYVLRDTKGEPDIVLIGTGSEVSVCLDAADVLARDDVSARVVSMPSWDLFEVQDESYQAGVLPPDVPILAVEAASSFGWDRWADDSVSIDRFGASAPGEVTLERLGFTGANVAERAIALIEELEEE